MPYIVIFCLAVETSSPLYLEKLASVVDAIAKATTDYRDVYRKQLAIFRLMYDVAREYVEVSTATGKTPLQTTPGGIYPQYDPAMGLPSQSFEAGDGTGYQSLASGQGAMEDEQARARPSSSGLALESWMDQNYQIFQMLDDDACYGL